MSLEHKISKLESIKEHEKLQGHKCSSAAATKTAASNTSLAEMQKLFRTAHAIAKKGRPFTDFVWMCELDEMKGLKIGET